MVNQETLWLQYLQALTDQVQLGAGEALQAIYPFQTWDWGGRRPAPNDFPYEQWQVLNVVPADPYQNTDAGAAATQNGFDTAYSNWFNLLAVGDLDHDHQYQHYQDQLVDATRAMTKDVNNAQNTWRNQTGGTGVAFDKWLAQPAQVALRTQLKEDKQDVVAKQEELDDYRLRIKTPVKTIAAAYNDTSFQGYTTDPISGKSVQVRLWGSVPASPYDYVEKITGNTFGGPATNGNPGEAEVTASSRSFDYSTFYAQGGAGWWDDFLAFRAGGSYEKIDWSTFSSDYHLSISWEDMTKVTVDPDGWYAGSNITTYGGSGPYATGYSAFKDGGKSYFFGPGGSLSRIYSGLIVAYRPSVTISASEEFASYALEKWKANAGILVGPFFFGSSASSETSRSTAKQSGGKLTLSSTADWPMIIGTTSTWTLSPEH